MALNREQIQSFLNEVQKDLNQERRVLLAKKRRQRAVEHAMLAWTFVLFLLSTPVWLPAKLPEDGFLRSPVFAASQIGLAVLILLVLVVAGGHVLFPSLKLSTYSSALDVEVADDPPQAEDGRVALVVDSTK